MLHRRTLLAGLALAAVPSTLLANDALWAALAGGGHVALMRHALAPGVGDPAGFRIDDCATQRNLSAEGRAAAVRTGEAFRARGVRIGRVLSSAWCRCLDTARALNLGPVETAPDALNSFFAEGDRRQTSTVALRALLAALPRQGPAVVMVTHQVNITALTGVYPASGEIVVLRLETDGFSVAGRIPPL